jgi:hypothetical protein
MYLVDTWREKRVRDFGVFEQPSPSLGLRPVLELRFDYFAHYFIMKEI